jgi:hypothetical protein
MPAKLPRYGDAFVPAGEYSAILVGYETWARYHGWTPRVVLVFTLVDAGFLGVSIPGYYKALRRVGKPRRNGHYLIGTRSRLYRDLARMLGRRPPLDHVPEEALDRAYRVVVRDVVNDLKLHPLGAAKYSVIDWVIGRDA